MNAQTSTLPTHRARHDWSMTVVMKMRASSSTECLVE